MISFFEERKKLFFIVLTLLFILLLVAYFFFLRPVQKDVQTVRKNVESTTQLVVALKERLSEEEIEDETIPFVLTKKLPLDRELRSLLLAFEEIELVSGSRIESIRFDYSDKIPNEQAEEDEQEVEDDDGDENDENGRTMTGLDELESVQQREDKNFDDVSERLKTVTASLIVISPDYEHFMKFLQELEQLERITYVTNLDFVKPAEAELVLSEAADETIPFNITVTTFYYLEQ